MRRLTETQNKVLFAIYLVRNLERKENETGTSDDECP
jgi:hypothetical protein